ncbi:MAG: ACP S-malonyltransferase [Thermoleophilia bacterium]|nr:ACP S-malonyltransferase [Thermoleophilia bacterium]
MPTALLFPGQGAPAADWRDAIARWCPELLAEARRLLGGRDPLERFGTGTEFDQPAIYSASIAASAAAARPAATFHPGPSLGAMAGRACAGAFSERDGLRVVVERGRLMAAAAGGAGAMLAVRVGADEVAGTAAASGVVIANLNSPSQTVLSGPVPAIERAAAELGERGIKAKRLAIGGAFHSPAMAPAAERFRRFLAGIRFKAPSVPVLSGRTGRAFTDPVSELAASLLAPVRWIDVVASLDAAGVTSFREIGPGRALTGLVRKILPSADAEASAPPEAIGA